MSHIHSIAARCLAVVAVVFSVPVWAQAPSALPTAQTAGLFFRSDVADKLFAAPVVASDVVIDVAGDVARVTVTQRFRNPSRAWLEGIYVYPLPERAAVDRLVMRIGERIVEGRILEREAAERAYKAALDAGNRASLLSSARPNIFSTRIANIGPGEEIVIEIGYQDQVMFQDGEWSYRFPLVVAPRYTPTAGLPLIAVPVPEPAPERRSPLLRDIAGRGDPVAAPAARDLFGPVRHPDRGAINPVSLAVRLDAGVPLAAIAAASHAVDIERDGDSVATVALAAGPVPADRDFVLHWRPAGGTVPRVGLFAETRDAAAHLLVALLPPDEASWPTETPPRDLVLVIDKSGSMHGASIAGAKEAARLALAQLTLRDRFNLIVFDDSTQQLFGVVEPATPANVSRAFALLDRLDADGGTEMAGALAAALAERAPAGRLRQVVFLTDGAVSNERALTDLIATRLGATRLFTVGLGSAPNAFFMRAAAEAGRGSFVAIDEPAALQTTMAALHRKLARPALTDIRVDWDIDGAAGVAMYPSVVPDLYIGDPVTFAGRLDLPAGAAVRGSLTVTGNLAGSEWRTTVPLDSARPADGVAAVWARARVAELRNAYPARQPDFAAMRQAVVDTALPYGLVTEFTSLVAVDDSAVARPRDETVERAEIERNVPAGMDFEKLFGKEAFGPAGMAPVPDTLLQDAAFRQSVGLPATATPAAQLLSAGVVLLLAGLLILVCTRRRPEARR